MNTSLTVEENYTRKSLRTQAKELTKSIENPVEAWAKLCRFEDLASYAKEQIAPLVKDAVRENEEIEEETKQDGVLINLVPGRVTWDYSHCAEWVELKERLQEIEGNMKKVAQSPGTLIINEETGEQYQAAKREIGDPYLKTKY